MSSKPRLEPDAQNEADSRRMTLWSLLAAPLIVPQLRSDPVGQFTRDLLMMTRCWM